SLIFLTHLPPPISSLHSYDFRPSSCSVISIKRKTQAPVISKTTRSRRVRHRALPPTPPSRTSTPVPAPSATPPPGSHPLPPLSIENCLQQMDAKLESAILEINTTFTGRLESIADLITSGSTRTARPMGEDTGITPQSSVDVLS